MPWLIDLTVSWRSRPAVIGQMCGGLFLNLASVVLTGKAGDVV
jgi:hypothetical protein